MGILLFLLAVFMLLTLVIGVGQQIGRLFSRWFLGIQPPPTPQEVQDELGRQYMEQFKDRF